jgi:hypothetical protein
MATGSWLPSSGYYGAGEDFEKKSALAGAIEQARLQNDLVREQVASAQQERMLKEQFMDMMKGYGTPGQRAEQMGGPRPALADAIQRGATQFSNISPGGDYSTPSMMEGQPSTQYLGMQDIQPQMPAGITQQDLLRKFTGIEHKPTLEEKERVATEKMLLGIMERFLMQRALKETPPGRNLSPLDEVREKTRRGETLTKDENELWQSTLKPKSKGKEKNYDAIADKLLKEDMMYAFITDPKEKLNYRKEYIKKLKEVDAETEGVTTAEEQAELDKVKKDPKGLR